MRKLIELREQCKSYLKDEDFIEALSLVLAVAKKHPEIARETAERFNQDRFTSGAHYLTMLSELHKQEPDQPWQPGCLEHTPPLIIGLLALYVYQHPEWVDQAAEVLPELYYSDICRHSGHTPALSEFLHEILGPHNQGAILDPFAGIGSLTAKINSTKKVLNEPNHQLAAICHRLAITQDRTERVHNFNYVLASCTPKAERRKTFDREQRYLVNQNQISLIVSDLTLVDSLYPQTAQYLEENFNFLAHPDRKLPTNNRAHALLVIQHALSQLGNSGEALFIVPNSWLVLGGYNAKVRNYLLEKNLLSEVILLDEINEKYFTRFSILRIQAKSQGDFCRHVTFRNQASARIEAKDRIATRLKVLSDGIGPEPSPNYMRVFEEHDPKTEGYTEIVSINDLQNSKTESHLLSQIYSFEYKGKPKRKPHQPPSTGIETQQAMTRLSNAQDSAQSAQSQLSAILEKLERK